MKSITCFKQRPISSSSKPKPVSISAQTPKMSISAGQMLTNYIDGYSMSDLEPKHAALLSMLKQFICSNNLENLSWKQVFLAFSKEGNTDFPFTDEEWLELCQVRNEKTALIRTLQIATL